MSKNSFLHPVHEIHFDAYKPEDVASAYREAEKLAHARIKSLLAIPSSERTFSNTIVGLCEAADEMDTIYHIVSHLAHTLGGPWEQQEADLAPLIASYYAERGLNSDIYQAVMGVPLINLSAPQKRLAEDIIRNFERSGVNQPQEKKDRLQAIQKELSALDTQFGQNVVKDSDAAFLHLADADALAGVDPEHTDQWAAAAAKKNLPGYYIAFSPPAYDSIMTTCQNADTRQAMHKLARSRSPENETLAKKMLALRREMAALLGYNNYADFALERRMAKNGQRAKAFIDDLIRHYEAPMRHEAAQLQAFIEKETGMPYQLQAADVDAGTDMYWAAQMRDSRFAIDQSALREYFPLESVLNGMFEVLNTLYGLTIKEAGLPTFHPDAKAYEVYDEQNRHVSTVWCDWFARKGKRAGAWQHTVYIADRSHGRADKPHIAFVCANFAAPTQNKPSLLTLRDVETMWHEFGHFIHVTCGQTELPEQNGYESKWDFIEAPSQIMENWVWEDEILHKIARHYKTGEPLAATTIQKLRDSRVFRAASRAMWTLFWSTFDLDLHITHDPTTDTSLTELGRQVKSRFFAAPIPSYDTTLCTFTHVFAGGYQAAYYGYKWAESIEADLFTRFKKEGVLNPQTGRDYRDKVLARGDEADPDVLVRDFLGRDTNPGAMLERDGIAV